AIVWPFITRIRALAGWPPVTRRVPARLAYAAGAVLERAYSLLGRRDEPRMTRFLALQLSASHWFDITAARRDLGYEPAVSTEDGLRRLAEALAGGGKKGDPAAAGPGSARPPRDSVADVIPRRATSCPASHFLRCW